MALKVSDIRLSVCIYIKVLTLDGNLQILLAIWEIIELIFLL